MEDNRLIVFIKNPELGKVKTRLAADVGDQTALDIYHRLVQYTLSSISRFSDNTVLYFSEFLDEEIGKQLFKHQAVQESGDLGQRMQHAFKKQFSNGANKVLIIGTDCPYLNEKHIEDAYKQLLKNDVVIGPAKDGGYYLLGMKSLHSELFNDIPWSTEFVADITKKMCEELSLSFSELEMLSDIDRKEDLPDEWVENHNTFIKK